MELHFEDLRLLLFEVQLVLLGSGEIQVLHFIGVVFHPNLHLKRPVVEHVHGLLDHYVDWLFEHQVLSQDSIVSLLIVKHAQDSN